MLEYLRGSALHRAVSPQLVGMALGQHRFQFLNRRRAQRPHIMGIQRDIEQGCICNEAIDPVADRGCELLAGARHWPNSAARPALERWIVCIVGELMTFIRSSTAVGAIRRFDKRRLDSTGFPLLPERRAA